MNRRVPRAGRAFWRREGGQTVVIVAVFMVVLLAVLGLVIDVGELYLTQRHLQTAADSAALAAAQDLPNSSSNACSYSASPAGATTCTVDGTNVLLAPSGANYNSRYGNVQTSAAVECLSVASAGTTCQTGTACNDPAGYSPAGDGDNLGCNAIKVTEQTTVKPFFMQILGFGGQNVTATSTAGIAGGTPHPLDVEMIDDTTASMQTADTCGGTPTDVPPTVPLTQEDCAKAGIRAFLTQLYPCQPALAHCDISDQTSPASLDQVGLVTFPGLASTFTTGTGVAQEMNCTQEFTHNATTPTEISYANNANYQIIPFSSDFRYSDAPTRDPLATLNPDSNLVRSVYWPGDFCPNGGYPVNVSGAATSSIGGGNTVSANNNAPPPIAAGASTNVDNSGIEQGNSVNTTNTSAAGITQGSSIATTNTPVPITRGSSTDTTNIGISGGVSGSGDTTSPGVVSANARSITINAPSGYAANSGDFQLVTVTARGLTSGWAICAVNTGWHTIATATSSAGTFVQTTFWTTTATAAGVFNIDTSSGCGTRISRTQATGDEVSAISVNYTGVNPATPLSATTTNQTGTTLTAPALANVPAGDEVVSVFGSAATFSTAPTYWVQGTGTTPVSTGADDAAQTALGAAPTPTAKTGTAAAWASETIALAPLLSSSISVAFPGDYSANTGDFLLVSVAVQGIAGDFVCTPTNWHAITASTSGSGGTALTQASFWTTSATTNPAVFRFNTNAGCTGTAVPAAASAVATTYNGVDVAATPTATTGGGASGTALTAPQNATTTANEAVVSLFGTEDAFSGTPAQQPSVQTSPSSLWTNSGEDSAVQPNVGNQAPQAGATTANSAPWSAQTIDLMPALSSSISVAFPGDYSANTGDFLLVSVAVQGIAGDFVCTPTNWHAITASTSGSGGTALTQASFWTTSATTNPAVLRFNTNAGCTGTAVPAAASAVATTYNGVDVAATPTATTGGGASGTALTAPQNATSGENEEVVSLFATEDAFNGATPPFSPNAQTSPSSTWANIGESAGIQQAAGNQAPQATASTGNSAAWTAQTIDLTPLLNPSITLSTLPSDYQANTGDFLLVSIAVQGFGGTVCKPAGAPGASWNALTPTTSGSGATRITQATFWTTASTASSDTFTFYPTSACTGTPVAAAASAVATTYTGVNVALTPTITSGGNGSGTALTAPQNPTTTPYEQVVNLFATTDAFSGATPAFSSHAQTSPSSVWSNIGESASPQEATGNQATQATATSTNSATWTAQTVDLVPLLSSTITVTPPAGYVGGGADLMLVSIAATGLGSGSICAPSSADWAPVPLSTTSPVKHTVTQGDLTQEAFYTSSSEDPTITFTFFSRPSCNGVPMNVGASAVAVSYTGVNTADPFDTPSAASASGTGTTLNPAALTTAAGDELVGLYASDASNLALTGSTILAPGNGLSPSSGATNAAPGAGSHSPSTATTSLNPADWTTETIALNPLSNTGIVVQRPGPQAADDFIVVTVTANGLATGNICAPDDGTWTELNNAPLTKTGGGVTTTQATYYGSRSGDSPESYLFTFQTNCAAVGTAIPASATAVAARFVGVNPITPIDIDASGNQIFNSNPANTGVGTTVNPGPVTPNHIGDWVLSLYGTTSTGAFTTSLHDWVPGERRRSKRNRVLLQESAAVWPLRPAERDNQCQYALGYADDRPRGRFGCMHELCLRARGSDHGLQLHRLRARDSGRGDEPRQPRRDEADGAEGDRDPQRRRREHHQHRHRSHPDPDAVHLRDPAGGGRGAAPAHQHRAR